MESILGVPVIYSSACKSIKIVAEYLTEMIDFLETQGLNLNDTTLIGHSLGAHLMGIAASKTKSRIKDIVGEIKVSIITFLKLLYYLIAHC